MNKPIDIKLIKAYSRLLKKETKKISVSLLCEKADVSRASFYVYYKSMSEFENKVGIYMMDKFFELSTFLLICSDEDCKKAIKKEDFFFDKYELAILKYMISGSNYLDFATFADRYYLEKKELSLFSKDVWEKHRSELDFFSRGYLMILILGMTGYMENTFEKDIRKCRTLFRLLSEAVTKN